MLKVIYFANKYYDDDNKRHHKSGFPKDDFTNKAYFAYFVKFDDVFFE